MMVVVETLRKNSPSPSMCLVLLFQDSCTNFSDKLSTKTYQMSTNIYQIFLMFGMTH